MPRRSAPVAFLAHVLALVAIASSIAHAQQKLPPELRPGSIGGVVQIRPGEPAVGATVSIVGTVLQTLVQPDGSFHIAEVPAGLYDVMVTGPSYQATTIEDVSVRASQATSLTITVKRYPLLSEVRVSTPARRAQPIYESSSSVTVVGTSDAPFAAGHSLDRVLASTPGVSLVGTIPSIRGSTGSVLGVGSRVGLYLDGIPLTSPDLGGPLYSTIPLAAIEQIEVVKGSTTTLYGPGVVSGAINVVTPRPAEQHKANINLYTGVYTDPGDNTIRWWGTRPQRFSGTEVMWTRRSRSLGVLLAGTLVSDDGYQQHEPRDRYDLLGRINVFLPSGGELRVTGILGEHQHGPQAAWRGYDSALFSDVPDTIPTEASTAVRTLALEYRGVESKSFSFTLRATAQNVSVDDERDDVTTRRSSAGRYLAEADLTSFLNRRISFRYGGLAQFDVGDSPQYGDGLTRTVGGFVRMEFTNLYDIVASLGVRADMVLMPLADEQNVLQLSPSVGVAYHPIPSTSFRATLARGYRSPTLAEQAFVTGRFGVPMVPNPTLGPEQSWQGEVGAAHRIDFGSASITGDAAFYVHEYFGMIEPSYNPESGQMTFVNLSRARMLGLDLEMTATVDRGLLVASLGVGVLSARDLRIGTDLQGRSPLTATASLTWRPDPIVIIVTYRHTARVPAIDAVTEALVEDARLRAATDLIDMHVALDLRNQIELPLSIYLKARNLMQSRGFEGTGTIAPIRNVEAGVAIAIK
jgi:outer membrane receptor protein involved in Fe transport